MLSVNPEYIQHKYLTTHKYSYVQYTGPALRGGRQGGRPSPRNQGAPKSQLGKRSATVVSLEHVAKFFWYGFRAKRTKRYAAFSSGLQIWAYFFSLVGAFFISLAWVRYNEGINMDGLVD
jgi:hypothetical protein